jgi:hypothetical protein
MLPIPPATIWFDEFMIEVHASWQNHLPKGAREDEFLQRSSLRSLELI